MPYISMPKGAAKAIQAELSKKYEKKEAESLWLEVKAKYDKLQKEQPDIGGKKICYMGSCMLLLQFLPIML